MFCDVCTQNCATNRCTTNANNSGSSCSHFRPSAPSRFFVTTARESTRSGATASSTTHVDCLIERGHWHQHRLTRTGRGRYIDSNRLSWHARVWHLNHRAIRSWRHIYHRGRACWHER